VDFSFTSAQNELRAKARAIADEVLRPRAQARDADETFPIDEARILAQSGLMGVAVDPRYGGLGLGPAEYALAVHEIAGACASTSVTMAVTNMVGDMIERFGNPEQKARFLPALNTSDQPIGSFCLSEPHSGSDAAGLSTQAVRDGDDYILNGTKMWVTSGAHCSVALVMARTGEVKSQGITAFLIRGDNPGFVPARAEDKMGLRGSNTVAVSLDNCAVPAADRLGEEGMGFVVAMNALEGGRIGIGAQALGIARSALTLATRWASARSVGQGAQFKLADAATLLDAGWLMMLRAAHLKQSGQPVSKQAAMAKVFATESAGRVVELAMEVMGPQGLRAEWNMERYLRDVRVTRIYEGTSEIQKWVIARELLGEQ
jgi:alkylation response protein AidB-like acyl-CoA dehydrogenase